MEAVEEERVGEALFEKASEYLDLCRSAFSVDKAQQAGRLGAELISSAGTVEKAVHVLNTVRVQKLGDHLAGAKQSAFKGISPLHQEYLQACAQDGVPSRREKPSLEKKQRIMDPCTVTKRSSSKRPGKMRRMELPFSSTRRWEK